VELIQVEQQDARDALVQTSGPLQELDPVPVWQVQVGGHQRHLLPHASQPGQFADRLGGRRCGQYPIVQSEPATQR
jgi:hypothetical protein